MELAECGDTCGGEAEWYSRVETGVRGDKTAPPAVEPLSPEAGSVEEGVAGGEARSPAGEEDFAVANDTELTGTATAGAAAAEAVRASSEAFVAV